jgi:dihydroorotate dehydrogenase (fumarate)
MANLKTNYLGIELKNPVVVAACSLSSKLDTIKQLDELGAGALVIRSLFEEQIRHEAGELDEMLGQGADFIAESLSFFPRVEHAGPKQHLMWIEKARAAVEMPLIGSINAITPDAWADYAKQMEEAGVNAIELNTYAIQADTERTGADIEKQLVDTVAAVRQQVSIPLAVKLSPFYTSTANVATALEQAGASGLVMFNRFFQPEIDPDKETLFTRMSWSRRDEMRVPLRWIALLYGRTGMDLIGNTGVEDASDVVRYLLAGAKAVQVATALYRNKVAYLTQLLNGIEAWMDDKGYESLDAFRGKLSQQACPANPAVFERAQYFDFLLRAGGDLVEAGA